MAVRSVRVRPPALMTETLITTPGVYRGISSEDYHADPVAGGSLSSTGARKLLPPSCPARFRWWADHPDQDRPSPAMNFGQAAHRLVLSEETTIVVMDVPNWRSPTAREERDAHLAEGRHVVKADEWEIVEAMAAALREDEWANRLIHPDGEPELTLVWRCERTGVMCRARLDWWNPTGPGRPIIIPEYKTAASAEPEAFAREVDRLGYHVQAATYLEAVRALMWDGIGPDPTMLHIVQERDPPYVVSIYRLDRVAMAIGASLALQAREIYRRCVDEDRWPGYVTPPHDLALPPWAERRDGGDLL